MAKGNAKSFDEITSRLDEIIDTVRSKDTSLERSLDLFDEAIELGSQAVDMVDSLDLSPAEEELLDAKAREGSASTDAGGDVAGESADASGPVQSAGAGTTSEPMQPADAGDGPKASDAPVASSDPATA